MFHSEPGSPVPPGSPGSPPITNTVLPQSKTGSIIRPNIRRIRHIKGFAIINVSSSTNLFLSTFISVHSHLHNEPIYISEVISDSISPAYSEVDFSEIKSRNLNSFTIRVWSSVSPIQTNWSLFKKLDISLNNLTYLSHSLQDISNVSSNSIIVILSDGCYLCPELKLRRSSSSPNLHTFNPIYSNDNKKKKKETSKYKDKNNQQINKIESISYNSLLKFNNILSVLHDTIKTINITKYQISLYLPKSSSSSSSSLSLSLSLSSFQTKSQQEDKSLNYFIINNYKSQLSNDLLTIKNLILKKNLQLKKLIDEKNKRIELINKNHYKEKLKQIEIDSFNFKQEIYLNKSSNLSNLSNLNLEIDNEFIINQENNNHNNNNPNQALKNIKECIELEYSRIAKQLDSIFPIEPLQPTESQLQSISTSTSTIDFGPQFTICNLSIPLRFIKSTTNKIIKQLNEEEEEILGTIYSFICQLVLQLSKYLWIQLRYPISVRGSYALIKDDISLLTNSNSITNLNSKLQSSNSQLQLNRNQILGIDNKQKINEKDRIFPLWCKETLQYRFEYGVLLLSINIQMLCESCGMIPVFDHKESGMGLGYDTVHTLLGNLKGLLLFLMNKRDRT